MAAEEAGIKPSQILISTHMAQAIPANDLTENTGNQNFGDDAEKVPISSTKSMTNIF